VENLQQLVREVIERHIDPWRVDLAKSEEESESEAFHKNKRMNRWDKQDRES
jgi:hypothetical protein